MAAKNANLKDTQHLPISYGHIAVIVWGIYFIYLGFKKPFVILYLPDSFLKNILEFIWNSTLAFYGTKAVIRIWLVPIWKFIFPDTKKLGRKLEWYDHRYGHLNPESRRVIKIRMFIVAAIANYFFLVSNIPTSTLHQYGIDFANFPSSDKEVLYVTQFFSTPGWTFLRYFSLYSLIMWFSLLFEGRSRFISRGLNKAIVWLKNNAWKIPLASSNWHEQDPSFNFSHFTSFVDEKGETSLSETFYEDWIKQNEKGLRTSSLVVGPAGSGKTQCFALPRLKQAIKWQAHNDQLKASIACADPKAELTDFIIEEAKYCGREEDLIVLSLESKNSINPILLDNIWDGPTSFKVAGWLVSAWLNFQGGESPEPYWQNQNYLLFRNLIVTLYSYYGKNISIYKLSKLYTLSSSGCFNTNKDKRLVNDFGVYILRAAISCCENDDEIFDELTNYIFEPIKETLLDENVNQAAELFLTRRRDKFVEERRRFHLENNKKLKDLIEETKSPTPELKEATQRGLEREISKILELEIKNGFKENQITSQDKYRAYMLLEAKRHRENILQSPSFVNEEQVFSLIKDATFYLLTTWSKNDNNTAAIVSNGQPFLQQFESPEFKRILSPENPSINFEQAILRGSIFVPSFPPILIGDKLADGIITLCKARWQHAVLSNPTDKRIKYMLLDEAQRVITFGGKKNNGDLEYMEMSRSFGGITELLTQSISALKAKSSQSNQFDKIHGVIRSIFIMGTNDPVAFEFLQKVTGEKVKKRLSKTIQESAMSPKMDQIDEKYHGQSDSLSVTYTESETLEKVIHSSDIQEAQAFTAFALLFDGNSSNLHKISLKPDFWPIKQDKWQVLKRSDFSPEQRLKTSFWDLFIVFILKKLGVLYRHQ